MTTPTMSRRFGVEIEFLSTITKEQAVMSLRSAGIRVESSYYTHDTTPYWKIVTDGSSMTIGTRTSAPFTRKLVATPNGKA